MIDCLGLIKGNHWIHCNREYVLIAGEQLWILKKDASLVACRSDLSNIYKVAFLSGNRALLGHGKNNSYRMISLTDGADIWRASQIKMDYTNTGFAISADEAFAYECYKLRAKDMFVRINLLNGNTDVWKIKQGLRTTRDIVCDENGTPCLLQTHYDEMPEGRISQNGVRLIATSNVDICSKPNWKYRWSHNGQTIAYFFLGSANVILTNDLHVVNLRTGEKYFLLENENNWTSPGARPLDRWFDESKRYITLMYDTVNVVVDWASRTMVARYAGNTARGCIIGDEYWIASDEGIRRLPFPFIEDIPIQKYIFWKPGL